MENKQDIIKALIQFQGEVPKIELNAEVTVRTKSGSSYKFKYADLPYIVETIQPTLSKCNILLHFELSDTQIMLHVIHESGQELTSIMPLKLGNNAQENGSLITYYKRYLITSALNIVADQDDDANINTGNKAEITPSENKIDEWLTETQFKSALKSDIKGINATLSAFVSSKGKGMKKEYKTQLINKLEELKKLSDGK